MSLAHEKKLVAMRKDSEQKVQGKEEELNSNLKKILREMNAKMAEKEQEMDELLKATVGQSGGMNISYFNIHKCMH